MYLLLEIFIFSGNVLPSRENKRVKLMTNTVAKVNVCTSTPLKETSKDNVCDISSILWMDKLENTTEKTKTEKEINEIKSEQIVTDKIIESKLQQEVGDKIEIQQNNEDKTLPDGPIFFPDIKEEDHTEDKNNDKLSENIIKYNSPLEHIQKNRFVQMLENKSIFLYEISKHEFCSIEINILIVKYSDMY